MHKQNTTLYLTANAVIAALYAALTIALAPISYGPVQFRVSEALTALPFLMPGSVLGISLGCVLANLYTGSVLDIVFGSLATLLAGLMTARFGQKGDSVKNRLLGCLMPVVFNAVIVGAVLTWGYQIMKFASPLASYGFNAATVGLGEAGVLYLIGYTLLCQLPKIKSVREFIDRFNAGTAAVTANFRSVKE